MDWLAGARARGPARSRSIWRCTLAAPRRRSCPGRLAGPGSACGRSHALQAASCGAPGCV